MNDRYRSQFDDDAFGTQIAPFLGKMEEARESAIAASRRRRILALAGVVGIGAGVYALLQHFNGSLSLLAIAIIAAGIGFWIWSEHPKSKFASEQRDTVMEAICQQVGDLSYSHACSTSDIGLQRFVDARIVPYYSSSSLEDLITGTYRECRFSLAEADLTKDSGDNSHTVFDGLLMQISLPKPVPDRVIIAKDHSSWGSVINSMAGWFVPGDRVAIPHAAFEEKYEVYSKNVAAALSTVTPDFVENFLRLPAVLGTDELLAAFTEDQFLLSANNTDPFLEEFSADTPVSELRKVYDKTVEETEIIHRVIDQLLEGDRYAPRA